MPSEDNNPSGKGDTSTGNAAPTESLLGGAPASGGAADPVKPAGDSLLGAAAKGDAANGAADKANTGDKPAEGQKTEEKKPAAPEKYEFKAPEGVTLDPAMLEKATPIFKELGLTQEAAQKLVDFQAAQQVESAKSFNAQLTKWQAEVKALPESDKVLGDAKLALNKLADPQTQALLAGSWMGSHPGIIKLLASAGKLLREDPLHEGNAANGSTTDPANVLFGHLFKK